MPSLFRPLLCLTLLVVCSPALAEDAWPRFRGPNGQGVNRSADIPAKWSKSNFLWRVKLQGNGHGSPIIWGDHLYLMVGAPGSADVRLECREANSGNEVWGVTHKGKTIHLHTLNDFASTTPSADAGGVYISWADAESCYLAAYSHDGAELWKKTLGPYESRHGYSRSPIVEDGVVYLARNEQKQSTVYAFDAKSGNEVWTRQRPIGQAAYDTPCVIVAPGGGKAIVSYSSGAGMDALDVKTGKVLWNVPDVFPQRCVSSPVYAKGILLGASGSGSNGKLLVAVKAPGSASEQPQEAYRLKKAVPYVPTPIVVDDLLILWHERGTVACFDLESGKRHWLQRVGGKYFASPVLAGDKLYNVSTDGEVVVLSASREGSRELARNPLGEPTQATPAVVGNRMYVRTEASLMCVGSVATASVGESDNK